MDYDDIFNDIGQFGKWQQRVFAIGCLCSMVSSFLTLGFSSFIGFTPKFRCFIPQCDTNYTDAEYNANYSVFAIPKWGCSEGECLQDAECKMYAYIGTDNECSNESFDNETLQICDTHVYDTSDYKNSFITELDLAPLCESDHDGWPFEPLVDKSTFIKLCYMFGLMIGSTAFGYIADKIGRKKTLFIGILMSGTSFLIQSFLKNFWAYSMMQILTGFAAKGVFMIAFVLCMEVTGSQYTRRVGILIEIPYAMAEIILSLLGYLIQEWNILQIVLSLIVLCLTVPCWWLPESPRWLIADDKRGKAFVVLNRGANINGREFTSKKFEKLFAKPSFQTIKTSETEKMGFKTLFHNRYIAKNTIALSFNFMVCSMCYYGLALNQVNLGGNIYVSFALGGLVETVGYLFAYLTIDHMGRKTILIFCQVVAGISCIVGGIYTDNNESQLVLALSLIGKFGSSASFSICYLYMAELCPTLIRSTAVGLGVTSAQIGGLVAPLIDGLGTIHSCIPLIVIGSSSVIGGALAVVLPETLAAPLPQTLEEVKTFANYSKPWWKWIDKTDLAILHFEKTSHLKRNSIQLAKDRFMSRNFSILKRPSIHTVSSGDFCPVIPGGKRNSNDSSESNGTVNDGCVDLENEGSNINACDYSYDGYTLEITDKVRIVTIPDGRKEDKPSISSVTEPSKETINKEPDKPVNKKSSKRVQFWGYDRE